MTPPVPTPDVTAGLRQTYKNMRNEIALLALDLPARYLRRCELLAQLSNDLGAELEAALQSPADTFEQLRAREQVLFDIHAALGIAWGDDPYARIAALKGADPSAVSAGLRERLLDVLERALKSCEYYDNLDAAVDRIREAIREVEAALRPAPPSTSTEESPR